MGVGRELPKGNKDLLGPCEDWLERAARRKEDEMWKMEREGGNGWGGLPLS